MLLGYNKHKVVCHAGCGKFYLAEPGGYSVGCRARATGYHPVWSLDDIVWYCPVCYAKAKEAALSFLMVVKDREVRLREFLDPAPNRKHTIEIPRIGTKA